MIHVTKNSTKEATTVLGNLVLKLTKSPNFDEDSILTVKQRTLNANMAAMCGHVLRCINNNIMKGMTKERTHLLCDNNPIKQPAEGEEFDQLEGISSNYQFIVNNVGCRVYQRKHSYWCLACMSKLMQSTLSTWGEETYSIGRCISSEHETTTIYHFNKRSCHKKRGEEGELQMLASYQGDEERNGCKTYAW